MEKGQDIKGLFKKWLRSKQVESLFFVLAFSIPLGVILSNLSADRHEALDWQWLLLLIPIIGFTLWRTNKQQNNFQLFSNHLDNRFPSLEHSTSLLAQPREQLSGLSLLQKQKVSKALNGLSISFPISRKAIYALFAALLLSSLVILFWPLVGQLLNTSNQVSNSKNLLSSGQVDLANDTQQIIPEIEKLQISIQPPAYTGLVSFESLEKEISVPYYSKVSWNVSFTATVAAAKLVFGQGKEILLSTKNNGIWTANQTLIESQFFSLHFQDQFNNWHKSDYYQLSLKNDLPVQIEVENLAQFAEYVYTPEKTINFTTVLQDDYGISESYIVATLSKGEGESVTFKDDTLRFNTSFNKKKRNYTLQKTIKLTDLGMEPGDELYLHFEAIDNRIPQPQLSKTYKYIVAFEDTTQISKEMYGRMAVNRMPDYFRSQRQIIIDTEKLIARRWRMSPFQFKNKSNNIAADQKLLRLRYGQFLGEEFETVIGPGGHSEGEAGEHVHDEECAHDGSDGVMEREGDEVTGRGGDGVTEREGETGEGETEGGSVKKSEGEHGHDHSSHNHQAQSSREQALEEALLPYYHVHDIAEEVTFFDAATSAKLRAALANMWDAELHLRMGEPRKALPYEYKALELIKEVQQASRVYVERVGFEPPEIKIAEKRLSGELDEIQSPSSRKQKNITQLFPSIKKAMSILESMKADFRYPRSDEKIYLQNAGEELASIILQQENNYLIELQQLRSLMEKDVPVDQFLNYVQNIQKAFSKIVPDYRKPQKNNQSKHKLKELYLKEITD